MATGSSSVTPPEGYTLEGESSQPTPAPGLPEGYTLETETPTYKSAPTGGAEIKPVTTSTNPKLAAAESAKDMPEYVGATGAAAAGLMGASIAEPAISSVIAHLGGLDKIVKVAKAMGYASFSLKEAHDLYKAITGDSKK